MKRKLLLLATGLLLISCGNQTTSSPRPTKVSQEEIIQTPTPSSTVRPPKRTGGVFPDPHNGMTDWIMIDDELYADTGHLSQTLDDTKLIGTVKKRIGQIPTENFFTAGSQIGAKVYRSNHSDEIYVEWDFGELGIWYYQYQPATPK